MHVISKMFSKVKNIYESTKKKKEKERKKNRKEKRKKEKEKNETSKDNRNMPIYKWSNYEIFIFVYSKILYQFSV